MKIDGKQIAKRIFKNLSLRVKRLKEKGVVPHLVIILVGDNPSWKVYVSQKQIKAAEIGAKTTIIKKRSLSKDRKLIKSINKLNKDSNVHAIIAQRPLPLHLDKEKISQAIDPKKDIDGFHPKSKLETPLARAVLKILSEVFTRLYLGQGVTLTQWLKNKKIVVIGKGQTGGGPVIKRFKELEIKEKVIDSKTHNPALITKTADIIISAVGKPNIVTGNMIKKGVILISVGMHKGRDGKFHGDYEEEQLKNKASFYTPTPGGVGPVNVACLLENLVKAAENLTN